MATYFFQLGSNAQLAHEELLAVFEHRSKSLEQLHVIGGVAVAQCKSPVSVASLQSLLGGTIKAGEIIAQITLTDIAALADAIEPRLSVGKNTLGVSVFGTTTLASVGMDLKRELSSRGHSIRIVDGEGSTLSSAQIHHNGLVATGLDISLIVEGTVVHVGSTTSIQDFEDWSERDYGRPARDAYSGMLPPKLARMMLNIAGVQETTTVLDPFCGSGTVLSEALAIGVRTVYGSDVSTKAVADSKKNTAWADAAAKPIIFHHDARRTFPITGVDMVVAETFLGPARLPTSESGMRTIQKEIQELLHESIVALGAMKQAPKTIVLAIPMFRLGEEWLHISNAWFEGTGYKKKTPRTGSDLFYARPTATVGREIVQLTR